MNAGLKISKAGGFTLIEMLVASAIFAVILGALYSTFFLSHKAVEGLDDSALRLQECRAALDVIRRELDACLYRDGDKNTVFKLEDRDVYGKHASGIVFTAFSPLRSGVSELKYFVKESDGKLIICKQMSTPFGINKGVKEADLIDNIEEFVIEARYGDKWIRTWDSAMIHRIPGEVKISLKIKTKNRDVPLFVTARPAITR